MEVLVTNSQANERKVNQTTSQWNENAKRTNFSHLISSSIKVTLNIALAAGRDVSRRHTDGLQMVVARDGQMLI
jgi:hypothetical protein